MTRSGNQGDGNITPTAGGITVVVVAVFACIGLAVGAFVYRNQLLGLAQSQPTAIIQPTVVNQPTVKPANKPTSTVQPVVATRAAGTGTAIASTQVVATQPSSGTTVASTAVPQITPAHKTHLKLALVAFPSYNTAIQVAAAVNDDPSATYDLEIVPLYFVKADGTNLNEADEATQAANLASGEYDLLLTTSDALVKNPAEGKWIFDGDQSAGADQTYAWATGVTKQCAGKPIIQFNDLRGCVVTLTGDSVSEFQLLSFMIVATMKPSDLVIDRQDDVAPAVDKFLTKDPNTGADGVVGWVDPVNRAGDAGATRLLSSSWLRNLYDSILISNQADADPAKHAAVLAFLHDWVQALNLQKTDLAAAGKLIANWTYDGEDTQQYTGVFQADPSGSMQSGLSTIAQAGLGDNGIFAQHPELLTERFNYERKVWKFGGGQLGEPFDATQLYDLSFLQALLADSSLQAPVSGSFVNSTYSPVPPTSPQVTADQLISEPTVATFGCESFKFEGGADVLDPGSTDYQNLKACAENLVELTNYSDVSILITGSAAWPKGLGYTATDISSFGLRRAVGVWSVLKAAGVPIERMATTSILPPPERQNTLSASDPALVQDRSVKVEIKRGGQ